MENTKELVEVMRQFVVETTIKGIRTENLQHGGVGGRCGYRDTPGIGWCLNSEQTE